jgi:DNA sulfur modification protein DndB
MDFASAASRFDVAFRAGLALCAIRVAFHCLDGDEEIKFFDIINTKARGIGSSLIRYLRRILMKLVGLQQSNLFVVIAPFLVLEVLSVAGIRGDTLRFKIFINPFIFWEGTECYYFILRRKMALVQAYYCAIKENFPNEWNDYQGHRMTHIVCLDALSLAGAEVLSKSIEENKKHYWY